MGAGTSPAEPKFFVYELMRTFRQLRNGRFSPNLVAKRSSMSRSGIRKDTFETFHFRCHLPPKSEIENRSNKHLHSEQATGHGMHYSTERYCLLHVVVQVPESFRGRVNFSLRSTAAELRGVKVAQFSDFGLFSLYKTPKTYPPVTSLQPSGYIAE